MSDYVVVDKVDEVLNAVKDKKKTVLKMWGAEVETEAKELTPVNTGRLRNSITYKVQRHSNVLVGSGVSYAPNVEFNESVVHSNGQAHFLRDGILHTADKRNEIAKDILGSLYKI